MSFTVLKRMSALSFVLALCASVRAAEPFPIFDAHLHYNEDATARYSVEQAFAIFRKSGVIGILVSSRPNDGTRALYEAKAKDVRVVPFIRPYADRFDPRTWYRDPKMYALIESEMKRGYYRGIGEFHLNGADAGGAQVKRVVDLAVATGFVLHAHSDEEAIERLFAHNLKARIIWAHTGFHTPADKVERYLARYPGLWCELSGRSGITGSDRKLTAEWKRLFEKYPERFLLGSDTWDLDRWEDYGPIMAGYQGWLAQLPRDIAEKIAYRNAERLLGK